MIKSYNTWWEYSCKGIPGIWKDWIPSLVHQLVHYAPVQETIQWPIHYWSYSIYSTCDYESTAENCHCTTATCFFRVIYYHQHGRIWQISKDQWNGPMQSQQAGIYHQQTSWSSSSRRHSMGLVQGQEWMANMARMQHDDHWWKFTGKKKNTQVKGVMVVCVERGFIGGYLRGWVLSRYWHHLLQLLVSDAAVAVDCLDQKQGRLIIAGDHMVCSIFPEWHLAYSPTPFLWMYFSNSARSYTTSIRNYRHPILYYLALFSNVWCVLETTRRFHHKSFFWEKEPLMILVLIRFNWKITGVW